MARTTRASLRRDRRAAVSALGVAMMIGVAVAASGGVAGNGDQAHLKGPDDKLPTGTYAFQLHDLQRSAMSGPLHRDFANGS